MAREATTGNIGTLVGEDDDRRCRLAPGPARLPHRLRGSARERRRIRLVTVEASDPIGSPEKPLTNARLEAKFRDCAHNAVKPLSEASLDGLLATIGRLETLRDARELMTPFAG